LTRKLTTFTPQVTAVLNVKRAALDAARKRWLYRHRHIFEPLLRANGVFFDNLQKEIHASTDKATYVPIHQLDEQPKLIKGGSMKDYQVTEFCVPFSNSC
jgi:SWI/SNF-related matrix-associated actin-dependent regulator of chromatin subfamily A member 5